MSSKINHPIFQDERTLLHIMLGSLVLLNFDPLNCMIEQPHILIVPSMAPCRFSALGEILTSLKNSSSSHPMSSYVDASNHSRRNPDDSFLAFGGILVDF
jgi:hypothetical protein